MPDPQNPLAPQAATPSPIATQPPPQAPAPAATGTPAPAQGGIQTESWEEAFNQFKTRVAANDQGAIGFQKKVFSANPGLKSKREFVSKMIEMGALPPDKIQITGLDDLIQKAGGPAPVAQEPGLLDKAMNAVKEHFMGAPAAAPPVAAPAAPAAAPKPQSKTSIPKFAPGQPNIPQRAWRNNNPGNLHFANQPGATPGEDGFAKFETAEAGFSAIKDQIALDAGRGMTVDQYIAKYAPPTENDTKGYLARVHQQLGIKDDAPLDSINPEKLARLQEGIESSSKNEDVKPAQAAAIAPEAQPKPAGKPENLAQQALRVANKPLLEAAKPYTAKIGELGKGHGAPAEFASGFAQGVADTGIDMTSLTNVGLMAGATLIGGSEYKAAVSGLPKALKLLKWAPQILHGTFTASMWDDIGKTLGGPEAKEAYEKGDYQKAGQLVARVLSDAFLIKAGHDSRVAKGEPTLTGAVTGAVKDKLGGKKATTTAPPPEAAAPVAAPAAAAAETPAATPDFNDFRRKNFILRNGKLYPRGEEFKGKPGYTEDQVRQHFDTGDDLPQPEEAPKKGAKPAKEEPAADAAKPVEPLAEIDPNVLTHTRGRGAKATTHPLEFEQKHDETAYRMTLPKDHPLYPSEDEVKSAMEDSGLTKAQLLRQGGSTVRAGAVTKEIAKANPGDGETVKVPKTIMTADELEAKTQADRAATSALKTKKPAAAAAQPSTGETAEAPKATKKSATTKLDYSNYKISAPERRIVEGIVSEGIKEPKKIVEALRDRAATANLGNEEVVNMANFLKQKGLAGGQAPKVTAEPPSATGKVAGPKAAPVEVPDNVKAAQDRMKARLAKFKSERGSISNKPVSEEDRAMLNDLYTIGKHYVTTGAKDFGKWSKQMVGDFGDSITEHLQPVWDMIQKRTGSGSEEQVKRSAALKEISNQIQPYRPEGGRKIAPAKEKTPAAVAQTPGFDQLSPAAKSILRAAEQSNTTLIERYKKANPAAHKEAMEYVRSAREATPVTKTAEPPKRQAAAKPEPAPEPNEAYDPQKFREPFPDKTPRMHRELSKRVPDLESFYKKTADSELLKQQPVNVRNLHKRMGQLIGDEQSFDQTLATRKDPVRNAYRKYLDKAVQQQPRPLSKIQADSLKVLAQADPDRAVNALMIRKGYTRDEAETLIRPYADKPITKTAPPPEAPKAEAKPGLAKAPTGELDHATALKTAEVIQGRFARATSDLRHYPLEFTVKDAKGNDLHTQVVKDPREMDSVRPTLAALVMQPGVEAIEYKAGGGKGTIPVGTAVKESANIRDIKPKAAKTAAPPTREAAEPDDPFGPAGSMSGEENPAKPVSEQPVHPKKVKVTDLALPNHGAIIQETGGGGKYQFLGADKRGMIKIRPVTGGETEYVLPHEWDQFKVIKPGERGTEFGSKLGESLKKD